MATGVSLSMWNGELAASALSSGQNGSAGLELSYPGKAPLREILATAASESFNVLQHGEPDASGWINRLYFGDNLGLLAMLLDDPQVCGKVDLIYIDPPFATKSVFQSRGEQADAYHDLLSGPEYVEFIRQRLVLLRELLSPQGSIYLHLDENMAFPMKVIMDEVFGNHRFVNWITRRKCNPKNTTRKRYGNTADYLMFYSKNGDYIWNRPCLPWDEDRLPKEYSNVDPETGRRYMKVPCHAPGTRNGETGQPWRGKNPPPGKHWQFPPRVLDEMDARGEIYWSPNGNPRRKLYLDQSAGVPVQDIWTEFRDAHHQAHHITGYPTEKNSRLLELIVGASSNEGSIVLDCFSGSGTTLAAASTLGRRWIGMDESPEAVGTTLRRFAQGTAPMGDYVGKRGDGRTTPSRIGGLPGVPAFCLSADSAHLAAASELRTAWESMIAP